MTDTPIYDRLMKESRIRQMIALDTEYFHLLSEEYPVESFNIEVEDFEKLKNSLLSAFHSSSSEVQEEAYSIYGERGVEIFNAGLLYAVQVIKAIFDQTTFEEDND